MNSFKKNLFGRILDWGDPFVIVVDTRNTLTGSSAENEWKFPQNSDTNDNAINFLVDWGDGQFSRVNSKAEASVPHVYATPGIYTIKFYKRRIGGGLLSPRYENFQSERLKILKVKRLGKTDSSRGMFTNCANLDWSELEEDTINIGRETMFNGNASLTTFGKVKRINFDSTANKTLSDCTKFDQPNLEINLNTNTVAFHTFANNQSMTTLKFIYGSKVNSANNMFQNCHAFNADLTVMTDIDWSKVTTMINFMTKSTANAKYVEYNPLYYDNLLRKLDQGGKLNVTLDFSSKYTSVGAVYRNNLVNKGWIITDRGLA